MGTMETLMRSWQYEVFCRQSRARGDDEAAAFQLLPVARAGRGRLIHRALVWLKGQLAAWEALQQELERPTTGLHTTPSSKAIGGVL